MLNIPMDGKSEQSANMNVVEVRRSLNELRKLWRSNTIEMPFFASSHLQSSGLSALTFSFLFVQSHHRNRPSRAKADTLTPASDAKGSKPDGHQ